MLATLRRLAWRVHPPVLVLGGGGARGFAHIGVLHVLESQRLRFRALVGTSMGATVAAMYAAHRSARTVEELWREALERDLIPRVRPMRRMPEADRHEHPLLQVARRIRSRVVVSMAVNRATMLDDKDMIRAFEFLLPDVDVADLGLPFMAVATDLVTGEEVRLSSGPLRSVVKASCSIPGLLPAVVIDGRRLVDGGVVAEIPVEAARTFGRATIAIDTAMDLPPYNEYGLALDTMMRTQSVTSRLLREHQLARVLHVIRPAVGHATWFDWGRFDELVEAGRVAARSWLGLKPEAEARTVSEDESDAEKGPVAAAPTEAPPEQ
jgi:NTE family protein